jgi:hypothetical protein
MLYIATKTNYYQRVYAFGVGYSGQRGATHTQEVRAVDTHSPTLPAVTGLTATRGVDAIDLAWTVPAPTSSDFPVETIVLRHGYPLARLPHPAGTTYPYAQTLSDSGIASDVRYDYEVFTWSEGISGGLGSAESDPDPTVGTIYMALHLVIPEFALDSWSVYYTAMDPAGDLVQLYWSYDGVAFTPGPLGSAAMPWNDGVRDYGYVEHQNTSNIRRYYKLLVYTGATTASPVLGWTNTFLTEGSASPSLAVTLTSAAYGFTAAVSPPDTVWLAYYDTAALDATAAYLQLYRSYGNLAEFVAVNSAQAVDFSTPYLVDTDALDAPRYYRVRAFNAAMAEIGWSNTLYATP